MTGADHDGEFEAYLRRRTVLQGHPSPRERLEPPQDLDDIVMKKARQAIQGAPPVPMYRAPRWALPVALAATLLLSFAIVLNVRFADKELRTAAPATPATQSAPINGAASPPLPAPPPPAAAAAPPESQTQITAARDTAAAPAPRNEPALQKAPAPNSALARQSTSASQEVQAGSAAATSPGTSVAQSLSSAAKESYEQDGVSPPSFRDPEAWLKRIESLRASGRNVEADEQWRRFRAAFPDFPLKPPPSLPSEPPK